MINIFSTIKQWETSMFWPELHRVLEQGKHKCNGCMAIYEDSLHLFLHMCFFSIWNLFGPYVQNLNEKWIHWSVQITQFGSTIPGNSQPLYLGNQGHQIASVDSLKSLIITRDFLLYPNYARTHLCLWEVWSLQYIVSQYVCFSFPFVIPNESVHVEASPYLSFYKLQSQAVALRRLWRTFCSYRRQNRFCLLYTSPSPRD